MNEIQKLAHRLQLPYIKNQYLETINESMDNQHSYEDFLKLILENEVMLRNKNGINNRIRRAKFPYLKYLEELKYDAFPLEVANKIRELQSLSFISQGRNIILVGNPGSVNPHCNRLRCKSV